MDYLKTQAPFWKKEETPQGALGGRAWPTTRRWRAGALPRQRNLTDFDGAVA